MRLNLIKFRTVKSTNNVAIKIIRSKKSNAGIIVSDNQTKGRGTMGKEWVSLNGNLFTSIFFELKKNMPKPDEFSLINPLIIKKVLNEYSTFDIKIKWPNDLLIKSRKVCGILQETITYSKKKFIIIGIGVNIKKNPFIRNYPTTNLNKHAYIKLNRNIVFTNIRKTFEKRIGKI